MKTVQKRAAPPARRSGVRTLIAVSLILALLVGGGICYAVIQAGSLGRTAMSTPHHTVDRAMLSYYFYDYYYAELEENGDLLAASGLDRTRPLAEQSYAEGQSWYDYFMEGTVDYVRRILVFAETAYNEGVDIATADADAAALIDRLTEEATEAGTTLDAYVPARYGSGVTEDDVYRAARLSAYAHARYLQLAAARYTAAELEAAYGSAPSDYRAIDYIVYPVKVRLDGLTGEAAIRDAYLSAEADANGLAAATSEAAFLARMEALIRAANPAYRSYEVQHAVSDAYVYHATPSQADEMAAWLSDAGRAAGDTAVFGENGDYRVVYFRASHARLDYRRANMRHILFAYGDYAIASDAYALAGAVRDTFLAGDRSVESFAALVEQYSSDSATVASGGLYEGIGYGDLEKQLTDWLLAPDRVAGDVEVLQSVYGYHLVWFTGHSDLAVWQEQAALSLQNAAYNDMLVVSGLVVYGSALGGLPTVIPAK